MNIPNFLTILRITSPFFYIIICLFVDEKVNESMYIFIIFFIGLNKSNIYTPSKIENVELPRFESKELFSGIKIDSQDIIENSDYSLINIWASWCVPCRSEHEILMLLSKTKGLDLYGINYKDDKKNAIKFIEELGNPFKKIGTDNNGRSSMVWGVYGVPETFLINKNRKILIKIIGPINNDDVEQIREIING